MIMSYNSTLKGKEDNLLKKAYETPSVEMIAFKYRDQVVAASGAESANLGNSNSSQPILAGGYCNPIIDWIVDSPNDWQLCMRA